jgi:hypothetical protein
MYVTKFEESSQPNLTDNLLVEMARAHHELNTYSVPEPFPSLTTTTTTTIIAFPAKVRVAFPV